MIDERLRGDVEKRLRPGIRNAMLHRGGLRAEIVTGGTIRVGDAIRPVATGGG